MPGRPSGYYKKKGYRVRKARAAVPQTLRPSTAKAVKAIVNRTLSRRLEDKQVGFAVENAVAHNSAIGAADCEPLIGQVAMSTDGESYQRIGDKIHPTKLTVNGVISLNSGISGGLTQTPLMVRVMILAQKDIKVGSQILGGSVDALRLLKPNIPGADEVDYSGTTLNHLLPVNTDLFRVYMDKTFVLNGSTPEGREAINKYCVKWSKTFTKKQLPMNLTFDEGNANWANNFAPFLAVGYSYADGTAPDTVSTRIISTAFSQLSFEDA